MHNEYPQASVVFYFLMCNAARWRVSGRDVTPMFDRRKHAELPKGQAGFIRFVVLPLYDEINAVCSSDAVEAECLARALENLHNWNTAEEDPRCFQIVDQKQQETLQVELALLAAQKAINRRLSFRVMGHVQIVPPDAANGGADASAVTPRQNAAAEHTPTTHAAEQTSERRGSRMETTKELQRNTFHVFGQDHAVPAVPQVRLDPKLVPGDLVGHRREENEGSALPDSGELGANGSAANGIRKVDSELWPSAGTYTSIESRVRE